MSDDEQPQKQPQHVAMTIACANRVARLLSKLPIEDALETMQEVQRSPGIHVNAPSADPDTGGH